MVENYWKWTPGKIQFIADCGAAPENLLDTIKHAIDVGAVACYIQGETSDRIVREGKVDLFTKAMELIRANNLPAGIGAHRIETLRAVVDTGCSPDFWMKTFHNHDYWSAQHPHEHDNVFCRKPEETREFMAAREEPWIAFKVLAAGALRPEQAFRYAFEGGADFICVGMYDFQMVQNANTLVNVLGGTLARERSWKTPTLDPKELRRQERENSRAEAQKERNS